VRIAGFPVGVGLSGANVRWREPVYTTETLEIDLGRAGLGGMGGGGFNNLRDIAIPRLVLPANLPDLRIGRLTLKGLATNGEAWVLDDVVLDPEDNDTLAFESDFPNLPWTADSGHLSVNATPGEFSASLVIGDPDAEPGAARADLLQARENNDLVTRLEITLPLGRVDPALVDSILPDDWKGAAARGRVDAGVTFTGPVPQRAESATLALRDVTLTDAQAQMAATATVEINWIEPHYRLRVIEDSTISMTGHPNRWPIPVAATLETLALSLPVPSGETSVASAWLGTGTVIDIGAARPWPARVEGPVDIRLAAGDDTGFVGGFEPLRLEISDLSDPGRLQLEGPYRWVLRTPGPATMTLEMGTLSFTGIDARGQGDFSMRDGALYQLRKDEVDIALDEVSLLPREPGQSMVALEITAGGQLNLAEGEWQYTGPVTGSSIKLAPSGGQGLELLSGPWAAELSAGNSTGVVISSGQGQLDSLALPDAGLSASRVELDWRDFDIGALAGRAGVSTAGLAVTTADGAVMSGFDVDAQARLPAIGPVTGTGTFRAGSAVALPFAFNANLDTGVNTATLADAALPAAELQTLAGAFGVEWPAGVIVTGGELRLDGQLILADALTGEIDVVAGDIEAGFAESVIYDLSANLALSLGETITGGGPVTAGQLALAAGLDMTELVLDVALESNGDIVARNVTGQLFDGQVAIQEAGWRAGELAPATVDWRGFDLAALLQFMDVAGLEGSGTMNASVPVQPLGEGLAIAAGQFTATGPGRIAYSAGGPATNIGLRALENFHYDTFSGTIDYDPAGPYAVKMDLLGRNPDLYGGHPVKFGLNLGGEMPAVFRSLFLTGSFEEALLERLRETSEPVP